MAKYFPLLREVVQLALVVCDLLFLQIHPFHLLSQDRLQSLEHYPKKAYARVRLPGGRRAAQKHSWAPSARCSALVRAAAWLLVRSSELCVQLRSAHTWCHQR